MPRRDCLACGFADHNGGLRHEAAAVRDEVIGFRAQFTGRARRFVARTAVTACVSAPPIGRQRLRKGQISLLADLD